jgi:hypothetical protein
MQQVTASTPGDQDIGSHGSSDGWLTALAVHRGSFVPLHLHFPSPGATREVRNR